MGKYTSYTRTPPKPRNTGVHPLMRGIGCFMMVLVPILSWGLALLLVDYGYRSGWPIPSSWMGRVEVPTFLLGLENLRPVWNFLMTQPRLIAHLVFTVAIIVVIGGLMSVLYGYIYTIFGPPRYGPQDAPPIRTKVKRYKR